MSKGIGSFPIRDGPEPEPVGYNKNRCVVLFFDSTYEVLGLQVLVELQKNWECKSLTVLVEKMSLVTVLSSMYQSSAGVAIVHCDPTNQQGLASIAQSHSSADLLIILTGIVTEPKTFDRVKMEEIEAAFAACVLVPLAVTTAFLPFMKETLNAVIAIGTTDLGTVGLANRSAVCAARHALEGLIDGTAGENRENKVAVVSVLVPPYDTKATLAVEIPKFVSQVVSLRKDAKGVVFRET